MNRYGTLLILIFIFPSIANATDNGFRSGYAKYQLYSNQLSEKSLLRDYVDSPIVDNNVHLRLLFDWQKNDLAFVTDYQLSAQKGDNLFLATELSRPITPNPIHEDDQRLFDLTSVLSSDDSNALTHRLDRLYAEYTSTKTVSRLGRQAISWGNGLVYAPMDFINPFNPSSIDKEYKSGDDMFYAQYLQDSGNDLQIAWVFRRDENGELTTDVNTIAGKYHGFANEHEYDLLLARHYKDNIIGIGGLKDIAGAIWRGDITLTHTNSDSTSAENIISFVSSLSYSWVGWNHNMSGTVEYFYNGFGQKNGDYSPLSLANNTKLSERISRGELFTLGKHYLSASAIIEMNPLWLLTPNVFINMDDHSYLMQVTSTYDLREDWQLLAALNVPIGSSGTEYGGIESGTADKNLGSDYSLYAQVTKYF